MRACVSVCVCVCMGVGVSVCVSGCEFADRVTTWKSQGKPGIFAFSSREKSGNLKKCL